MMEYEDKAKPVPDVSQVEEQAGHIAISEHGELERNFSFWAAAGLAFAMLNSWTAMSASLSLVLPSGGAIGMVYGLIVSALGTMAMCLTMAEICHVYPLSGGQYHWAYLLAPEGWERGLAYWTGWMSAAGWISVAATGSSLGANFIIGVISFWHENYASQRWQIFLIYVGFTVGAWALNQFLVRALPMVDRVAFWWSLVGIVVVSIVCLAVSAPEFQPAEFVFTRWINETGWPDGVCFILGLLQSTFGLTGFDSATHLLDKHSPTLPQAWLIDLTQEFPNPAMLAPKIMVFAVALGSVTSFCFVIVLLFTLKDIDTVISSASGPLLQIYYQATSSRTGATCLLIFNIGAMAFATQGLVMIASRVVFSMARDRLFGPTSRPLGRVSTLWKVPTWALMFTAVWIIIFGLIFLGSSVALNAILSASVVFLQLSYLTPILLMTFRGSRVLEPAGFPARRLKLGIAGPPIRILASIFALVTTVFFVFPPYIPVTSGTTMNWVIVVVAVVVLMAVVNWFLDARRNYRGPENVEHLLARAAQASMVAQYSKGK